MNEFVKDFMQDVPRGDSTRYLRQQRTPQACWMKIEDIQSSSALTYDPTRPGKKVLIGALGSRLIGIKDPLWPSKAESTGGPTHGTGGSVPPFQTAGAYAKALGLKTSKKRTRS